MYLIIYVLPENTFLRQNVNIDLKVKAFILHNHLSMLYFLTEQRDSEKWH